MLKQFDFLLKKRLNKSNIRLFRYFDKKNLGSLPRTFLSSLFIILFFYSMPIFTNYIEGKNLEFQNNSQAVLAYTLNKDNNIEGDTQILDEKDLLVDILSLNDLETDTVRLNAATIKQLFEDTNYTLQDVRQKKLVKPVALTLLPNEIKKIESTKKEKTFLFKLFYLSF